MVIDLALEAVQVSIYHLYEVKFQPLQELKVDQQIDHYRHRSRPGKH